MSRIDALVCLAPGKLEVQKVNPPEHDPRNVLVRSRRVGICGTDYHIYEGLHPFLQYPRIMGHELAVEVVAAPPGSGFAAGEICVVNPYLSCGTCSACKKGKPNCCAKISVLGVHQDGGMQQQLSIPAENLIRADGLTADECATVEFLAIGAHAVRRGGVLPKENVLVVGAGPIGLGVALFSHLSGAGVVVADRDSGRVDAAADMIGVRGIVVDADFGHAVSSATDDSGFDVVFDATGNQSSMQNGFHYVSHGGRYVLVSVVRDSITFSDPDFHRKEMTLLGSRNATSEDFSRVISAIRANQVPISKIITHRTSLADAATKIPLWAHEKTGLIKALVEIT